jgi:flavin-dependent thymidylate synthase
MENTVELIGHYGSDRVIALSAWSSTERELTPEKEARIGKFVTRLWEDGHGTPFEKGIVHFLCNTDIATHVQLLKHRMASINGESARYKELKEDKYYIPKDWAGITYEGDIENFHGKTWQEVLAIHNDLSNQLYHEAIKDLEFFVGRKRAKESARFFKPYSMQYQVDMMMNMRSFANFLNLRNSEHAQKEIREVAQKMQSLVENIEGNPFEYTIKVITKNN